MTTPQLPTPHTIEYETCQCWASCGQPAGQPQCLAVIPEGHGRDVTRDEYGPASHRLIPFPRVVDATAACVAVLMSPVHVLSALSLRSEGAEQWHPISLRTMCRLTRTSVTQKQRLGTDLLQAYTRGWEGMRVLYVIPPRGSVRRRRTVHTPEPPRSRHCRNKVDGMGGRLSEYLVNCGGRK